MSNILDKYVEKGIEKGVEIGILQSKQLVLIRLLSKKFNISDDIKDYIKQCNDPDKLDNAIDNAFDQILSADNPDDILASLE